MGKRIAAGVATIAIIVPGASSVEAAQEQEPLHWTTAGQLEDCSKLISSDYITAAIAAIAPPQKCQDLGVDEEIYKINQTIDLTRRDFNEGRIPSKNPDRDLSEFVHNIRQVFVHQRTADSRADSTAEGLSFMEGVALAGGLTAYLLGSWALIKSSGRRRSEQADKPAMISSL